MSETGRQEGGGGRTPPSPQILALPLLLARPDFWPPRYNSPPLRFSDFATWNNNLQNYIETN